MRRVVILLALCALVACLVLARRTPHSSPSIASTSASAGAPVQVEVIGTVRTPGKLTISPPRLVEALRRTVPYILSDLKHVTVIHITHGVRVKNVVVDMTGAMVGAPNDILLETGDTIFVPEKVL